MIFSCVCACRISVAEQENALEKRTKFVAAGTKPALKGLKCITRQTVATAKNEAHRPFGTQYLPNRLTSDLTAANITEPETLRGGYVTERATFQNADSLHKGG